MCLCNKVLNIKWERDPKKELVLRYFLEGLESQKTEQEYCCFFRERIVSLIRFICPEMDSLWIAAKEDLEKREAKVLPEVKEIFEMLGGRINIENLMEHPDISSAHHAVRLAIYTEIHVLPARYEIAVWRLKELCYAVAALGRVDLLSEYVNEEDILVLRQYNPSGCGYVYQCSACLCRVRLNDKITNLNDRLPSCCPNSECDGEIERHEVPDDIFCAVPDIRFNGDNFVPSYFKLWDRRLDFEKNTLGAWNRFGLLEWGWPVGRREVFRKRRSDYNTHKAYGTFKAAEKAAKLFTAHLNWRDVLIAKGVQENDKILIEGLGEIEVPGLFTRERLQSDLGLVLKAMNVSLESNQDDFIHLPGGLALIIEYDQLRLIVQWVEGVCSVYCLHKFHKDENNVRRKFMEKFIADAGKEATKFDPEVVAGARASKYLEDAKIIGVLDTVLVRYKKGYFAALHSNPVVLVGKSKKILKKLREHLETLELIGWRHSLLSSYTREVKYRSL